MTTKEYYCHECAISTGVIDTIEAEKLNLTGTSYQCGKFMKHTAPTGTFLEKNSIFVDPTYKNYRDNVITGSISGMVEIDERGRKNIIWHAGKVTGVMLVNGVYVAPEDGVKIVLSENEEKIHAYPISGIVGLVRKCQRCGTKLPCW